MRLFFLLGLLIFPLATAAAPTNTVEAIIYTKNGECPLKLELAATPEAREHGLMDRNTLYPYDGMLFVFPNAQDYWFWMKDTRIPLDLLFINKSRTIVNIIPNAEPYSLKTVHGGKPVTSVIELDGGRALKEGIEIGDKVSYVLPDSVEVH